jgi:hypothetical protein
MVVDERIASFQRLHSSGCFVMPNPWDAGSAQVLEQLGFKALATTSAGLAWTLGRADNHVNLDEVLQHLSVVAAAVRVPVNADFEGGYAVEPHEVGRNVRRAVETGIAVPLGRRSTTVAPASSSRVDRRVSSSDDPTSTRRSGGCAHTPKQALTASTRRASSPSSRLPRSWPRWHRSR